MRPLILLFVVLVTACHKPPSISALQQEPLDAVIIPGCPNKPDGSLSGCQWQRAVWGAMLWEDGVTDAFITSGGAVQNRYIESESIKAAMVALGVPSDRIHLETQALHTDENTGYAMAIAEDLGFERLAAASHGGQARGMRSMMRGWGMRDAEVLPMPLAKVIGRVKKGVPKVEVEPVPEGEWLPLREREREIARRLDKNRRPPSWWVYSIGAIGGALSNPGAPSPPVTEPSLRGERHRVDTQPWPKRRLTSLGE